MQEPGMKELVEETLVLTKENNRLLRKMRRGAIYNRILQLVWLAAIIGVPFYLYFTILQPYVEEFGDTFEGFQTQVEGLESIPAGFRDILNNFQQPEDVTE